MGARATAVFADEFLFFNFEALPAILPVLLTGALFVMISSICPDGDSPILKVINAKYKDGTPVVRLLNWIQSCIACKRKGLQDKCKHIKAQVQHFVTNVGQERVEAFMSTNEEAANREIQYIKFIYYYKSYYTIYN
jgi:hypothetical protein